MPPTKILFDIVEAPGAYGFQVDGAGHGDGNET